MHFRYVKSKNLTTTYKLDPLVARPGPSMAMDGMPWSLSTGSSFSEKFTTTRKKTFAANTFMRMSFSFEEQALNLKKNVKNLAA